MAKVKRKPLEDLHNYISRYRAKHGAPPCQNEMADFFGVARNTIQHRLKMMIKLGMLRVGPPRFPGERNDYIPL